jgi:hypothetical protein
MIELRPSKCNICGGRVEYVSNAVIYGKEHGSGRCYRCAACGAYVGTHKPRPCEALGILADAEMRAWKVKCHALFDPTWESGGKEGRHWRRREAYARLAERLGIAVEDCHFGHFDLPALKRAFEALVTRRDG